MGTLLFTGVATSMLCVAIMTDHWEQVTWDRRKLDDIAVRQKNGTQVKWVLEWLLDGQVCRIVYTNDEGLRKVPDRKDPVTSEDSSGHGHDEVAVFLIPMHGGIWTLCVTLTGKLTIMSVGTATLSGCCEPYFRVVNCIEFTCTFPSLTSSYVHKIWHSAEETVSPCLCGHFCCDVTVNLLVIIL
jgi:hypothetical protein